MIATSRFFFNFFLSVFMMIRPLKAVDSRICLNRSLAGWHRRGKVQVDGCATKSLSS